MQPLELRTLLAGEFTDLGALGLTGVFKSDVAWGDSDNDNDLDVLVTGEDVFGQTLTTLYRNNGSNFTSVNISMTGVKSGASEWGDYDRDGDLDLVITGADATLSGVAKIYRNDGSNTFTDINAGLVGVESSDVAWGDYDSDGDLDLVTLGSANGMPKTTLYRNDGNGVFTDANAPFLNLAGGNVAWGDYNRDGTLDLVLTGIDESSNLVSKIYRNLGDTGFVASSATLLGVANGDVAWGDSDNDGDLDLLIAGATSTVNYTGTTKLYRNDGGSTFTDLNVGLPGIALGSVAWGDRDNDGDLDVLVAGSSNVSDRLEVYRNNGNNSFDIWSAGMTGGSRASAAWGDMNNDGDLDILFAGLVGQDFTTKFYRNNISTANTAPQAPTNLQMLVQSPGSMSFFWNAAVDGQTPSAALSYNLRVGTTPGGNDVYSGMADSATGTRRLPATGPIQPKPAPFLPSHVLENLDTNKTYYWSVQAIDASFAGSPFAAEQTANFPFKDVGTIDTTSPSNNGGVINSAAAWGDYDNDGDMDMVVTGQDITNAFVTKIYRNNGNLTFSPLAAGLTGVSNGDVAWGDYDNDGRLDVIVTGINSSNAPTTKLYRNAGNDTFTTVSTTLVNVTDSAVAWGDMDNDGDLDLFLSGRDGSNVRHSKVYRNTGGTFTDLNVSIDGVTGSAAAWGDTDRDGDLDLVLTGLDNTNTRVSKVYRNNGDSTFTDLNLALTGVTGGSVAWGDYDNDGDLDLMLAGQSAGYEPAIRVYRNEGSNTFTDTLSLFQHVSFSSVDWGDFDNDGDLDILLAGFDTSFTRITRVLRNTGTPGNLFEDINASLTGVDGGTAAFGDADSDGDLDILLTGADASFNRILKVYKNNSTVADSAPGAPTSLTAAVATSTSLTFSWTAPTDNQTSSAGLSYNLRVGTTPGGSNVFTTMAHTTNGRRRLPSAGPIQGTSFTLKNLTPGTTYYWSVQAVDPTFVGGAFAVEQQKVLPALNNAPAIGGLPANQSVNDNATISPFAGITITDPDTQNMFTRVTILNGVVRGDFTTASAAGWTRTVSGNNIVYTRSLSSQANIGTAVQAAIRPFVFQPRTNAIKPNTLDLTDITVFVNDGVANTTATTRIAALSVNNVPTIGGASNTVAVNDNANVNPLATLTVTDADMQEMLISVTILNGVNRGDFTNATLANGWTVRQVLGNNITYKRYFGPQTNVGAAAQAAFRALTFQPRQNAIKPNTTEQTDFQVTVSDGVAPAVANTGTRVTTTSVNNNPLIVPAAANQTMNDNQTKAVFSTLTVSDPDTQDLFVRITIQFGTTRGDFTTASTNGWTRKVTGANLTYERFFAAAPNNGAVAQAAIRAMVFQPRSNIPIGTTETTVFEAFVNDGLGNTSVSTAASVITTGVAPRVASSQSEVATLFRDSDIKTAIVPTVTKPKSNPLARLLKRAR